MARTNLVALCVVFAQTFFIFGQRRDFCVDLESVKERLFINPKKLRLVNGLILKMSDKSVFSVKIILLTNSISMEI